MRHRCIVSKLSEQIKRSKQRDIINPGGLPFNVTIQRPSTFTMQGWQRWNDDVDAQTVLLNPVSRETGEKIKDQNGDDIQFIVLDARRVLRDVVVGWSAKELDLYGGGAADKDAPFDVDAFIEFVGDDAEAYQQICNEAVQWYLDYHAARDNELKNSELG